MGFLFSRILQWAITTGIGDFLKAAGIGLVVFAGLDLLFDQLFNILQNHLNGITPEILAVLQIMGFSTGLSMFTSAISTAIAYKALTRTVKLSGKGSIEA